MSQENRWLAVAIIGVVAMIVLLFNIRVAPAHDIGQWENSDHVIRKWFDTLMRPDAPESSCCGVADAYWAD